jgi:hypothetical protein
MPAADPAGVLSPNQWTKVMWAWGYFKLTYQVSGSAFPLQVRMYQPLYSEFTLQVGGAFQFGPIGYGDVWFFSPTGGSYRISPLVSRPY